MQRDSDEEVIVDELKIDWSNFGGPNFSKFVIEHQDTTVFEDVKRVLGCLEKDTLLLDLIPIAFNDEMDTKSQIHDLFFEKNNSIAKIWDFVVITF